MKIALHICCAVCAAGAVKSLLEEGNQVFGFFFNPNIQPLAEYQRRLGNARTVARELAFSLWEDIYIPEIWQQKVVPFKDEPEGGKRCTLCFRFRLEQTCQHMLEKGYDAFTTTLTMGSNKSAILINQLGEQIGGDRFIKNDFKKKDGFKRANELANKWGLYRQNYCGCIYSLEARHKSVTIS